LEGHLLGDFVLRKGRIFRCDDPFLFHIIESVDDGNHLSRKFLHRLVDAQDIRILLLSGRVRSMSLLVVCGVMIGYICSAVTELVVTFADDSNIVNLHNWSMGSFSGLTWGNVATMSMVVLPAFAFSVALSKPMGAYQMGEGYARSLGVDLKGLRLALILLSSLLSACVTAFAGPISFVGIAVPHLMKTLLGTARPLVLLPACFLGGGVFCLLCDLLARTLFAPTELSISTVTAVFGAPVVIWMLLSSREGRRRV
jgi:iron complex transport system permease protein